MNFSCQHCHRVCDWETREPVASDDWKTIGHRYCNAEECIQAEEKAHGLPRERLPWRNR